MSPALIFDALSKTEVVAGELAQIILVMVLFDASMTLLAYGIGRWRYPDRVQRAGLMVSAMCPNTGNYGLPLVGFAFDSEVLARAVVVYIAVSFLNNSIGIFLASSGRRTVRDALLEVARVPILYAAFAGLLVNMTNLELPPVVARSVGLTAQGAVPAMTVLLGLQLAQVQKLSGLRPVGVSSALRLLGSPFVALAWIVLLGVHGPAVAAIMMQASMPVAVATIIFATEYGLDEKFMSSTVLVSTILSPITLSVLILVLQRGVFPVQ